MYIKKNKRKNICMEGQCYEKLIFKNLGQIFTLKIDVLIFIHTIQLEKSYMKLYKNDVTCKETTQITIIVLGISWSSSFQTNRSVMWMDWAERSRTMSMSRQERLFILS